MDNEEVLSVNKFKYKHLLQQHAGRVQGALDSSNAMVAISQMALRGTMILNGAGIIPIVYSKVDTFYQCAIMFGAGAFLSVCASCITYLAQWAMYCTWKTSLFDSSFKIETVETEAGKVEQVVLSEKVAHGAHICGNVARFFAIFCVAASLVFFAIGLYQAQKIVSEDTCIHKTEVR